MEEIIARARTIAVVGASGTESKPAHRIPRYLAQRGYRIVPVNPRGGELFGEPVRRSVTEIDVPIDILDVFRPPAEAEAVAREAIVIRPGVLWFQPGTDTPEAVDLARAAGLTVVTGHCLGETHRRLGLGPADPPSA